MSLFAVCLCLLAFAAVTHAQMMVVKVHTDTEGSDFAPPPPPPPIMMMNMHMGMGMGGGGGGDDMPPMPNLGDMIEGLMKNMEANFFDDFGSDDIWGGMPRMHTHTHTRPRAAHSLMHMHMPSIVMPRSFFGGEHGHGHGDNNGGSAAERFHRIYSHLIEEPEEHEKHAHIFDARRSCACFEALREHCTGELQNVSRHHRPFKAALCLAKRDLNYHDVPETCMAKVRTSVAGACPADIQAHCSEVKPGQHKIQKCLLKQMEKMSLSKTCWAYFKQPGVMSKKDWKVMKKAMAKVKKEKIAKEEAAQRMREQKVQFALDKAEQAMSEVKHMEQKQHLEEEVKKQAEQLVAAAAPVVASSSRSPRVSTKIAPATVLIAVGCAMLGLVVIAVGVAIVRRRRAQAEADAYHALLV
jgi:hypothetical protein